MADYEPVASHKSVADDSGVTSSPSIATTTVLDAGGDNPNVEHSADYASVHIEASPPPESRLRGAPPPPPPGPRQAASSPARSLAPPSPSPSPSGSPSSPGNGPQLPGPGERINQYEIIRELGRGGMGAVYLARDIKLGRRVALKLLQSSAPQFTQRFIVEARATAQCSHENIVVIYEVNEHRGNPFMALEYLQGTTLTRLVAGKTLTASRVVQLMAPVARALECAHELGIVHRDLKPDNIFVTSAGRIKVLDFGIAKFLSRDEPDSEPSRGSDGYRGPERRRNPDRRRASASRSDAHGLTQHGALIGTRSYMSPEQWGAGAIDHRTDLWALGILLFRMVTGRHPLAPLRGQKLAITKDLDRPMPRVRSVRPDVPAALADAIDRCLIKRKEQRMASARELLDALEPLLPGQHGRALSAGESPYAGLTPFQEGDADRFFGRSREIVTMLARLREKPLVGVVGPSGVGKSSFVRAGVIPALKRSGETWETHVVRPGRHPLASLANVVTPMVTGESASLTDEMSKQRAVLERLTDEPGYLGAVLRSRARRQGCKILLFIDQFEELYTLTPNVAERMAFTACLAGMADDSTSPLRVSLSIRSDLLDRVAEDRGFMAELSHGLFFLTSPDRASLEEALIRPAEAAGFRFETPRMTEQMIAALDETPGALPLLQFTASKLWEARDGGRGLLTEASYNAIGGIAGALASHANAVLSDLSAPAQGLVRRIFMGLVTPERTRALVSLGELRELSSQPDEVGRLIDHLVAARLLVVQKAGASQTGSTSGGEVEPMVELVHESLITSWPLLRRWLEDNQDDAAFLDQLRTAARQWDARGRPSGLLWRGEAMVEARRWRQRYGGELPRMHTDYLDAVFALAHRASRKRRILLVSIISFLSLLVAAAAVALVLIRNAEKNASEQASLARTAEREVREKLELVEAKERERQAAEQKAAQASGQVELSKAELERANHKLRGALSGAQEAKSRAEREEVKARAAAKKASEASREARRLAGEAQRANSKLERLLAAEKRRVKELKRQLGGKVGERLK